MRGIILYILLIFSLIFTLSKCDNSDMTVVNSVYTYTEDLPESIWGRRFSKTLRNRITAEVDKNHDENITYFDNIDSISAFIPHVTKDAKVVEYYNEYGDIFLAYKILTLLSVQYTEAEFDMEISRLSSLKFDDVTLRYDTENFNYPAIVAALGESSSSEYILIDRRNLTLHYVYAQFVKEKDWAINRDYLPHGYYGEGRVSTEATGQPLG